MIKLLAVIFLILCMPRAWSQEMAGLNFTRFDSKGKLPSDEFLTVYQDRNDGLWFGNHTGLLQYDGYDFKTPSWLAGSRYSNTAIRQMCSDPAGILYMATDHGLLMADPSRGTLKMVKPPAYLGEASEEPIQSVAYQHPGKIWIGTASRIVCYWPLKDSLSAYPVVEQQQEVKTSIQSICVSPQNEVWIGTWGNGLARWNEPKQQFEGVGVDKKRIAPNIRVVKADRWGRIWAGSWKDGLFVLDISKREEVKIVRHFIHDASDATSIAGDIVLDLDFDTQDRAWIGTPYGLSILAGDPAGQPRFINYQQDARQTTIANNAISAVLRDRSGNMWLATDGGGINKVAPQRKEIERYAIPNVDPLVKSQSVNSFTVDRKNRLLVGVKGLGFGVYDLKTRKFTLFSEVAEYKKLEAVMLNTARCFAWDQDSSLWIGTRYKGIIKLDTGTGEFIHLSNLTTDQRFPALEVFAMHTDRGGKLWVATNNGLFGIGKGSSGKFDDLVISRYSHQGHSSESLSENPLSDVLTDDEGYLWVSTFNNGINRSRGKALESETLGFEHFDALKNPESGLGTNKILCIFKSRKGKIWVGTAGKGLKYWNREANRFEQSVLHHLNEGIIVYAIREDKWNNLWITTNKGISRVRGNENEYEVDQFSFDDGLQGNVFIKGAAFIDSADHLYVGGHNGFNRINLEQVKIDQFIPKVLITSVKVDDKTVNTPFNSPDQPLVMTHTDQYFTISFSSLDFSNPDQNKYAYMLEGFDRKWQYANSNARSATFGNLSPGRYQFMLKGTNSRGKWNPEPTVFYIQVKTAPYKTGWAISGYILLAGGLIYLFISLRIKNIQIQKSLELENIERAKLENLTHFKLQFFTNISHELLTPLSILKILSERWDEGTVKKQQDFKGILERNVSRLHGLITQILQFRKAETGNMKISPVEVNIVSVIQSICSDYLLLAEKKNIGFHLEQPDELSCFLDTEKLDMMLNNLISNAFKYTSEGGSIGVRVLAFEKKGLNWIRMEVSDNGIGISGEDQATVFDRFYRIGRMNVSQTGIGIGLALTKNLVTLHGGTIGVESELGKGTTFNIELPVSADFYRQSAAAFADPMIDPEKIIPGENMHESLIELAPAEKMDKVVLLVENEDDYRILLKEKLEKTVRVIACSNGQEALEIASDQPIDLIISDLNMPVMNGNEFCKVIKSNINTSHIPFILVTAFPDEKERSLGYESGVDSYLNKPLNINVLMSRMKSLLKQREEIQQKFTMGAFLEPKNIATTSLDEKIIEKAKNVIEANISNPDFSVKTLCDELGMTNSTLYRKMKGILNVMPNEFIRNIRLRRAAQLLEDPALDIAEAAYSIGFNDPSYFSACFKKQYNVTPSAYQKGKRSKTN